MLPYKDDMPLITLRIRSFKGEREFNAHIDFAATKTLVPAHVSSDLDLPFRGFIPVATGGGTILMPLYRAEATAFGKMFLIYIACFDLPKESPIKALIGRDILDHFKVCLNGKKKETTVADP